MKIHKTLSLLLSLGIILVTIVYSTVGYLEQRDALIQGIDEKLHTAAMLARAMTGRDYHDAIQDKNFISEKEYLQSIERYNLICEETNIQYLWSVMLLQDTVVFTSSTSKSHDIKNKDHALFFDKHSAPAAYMKTFASMKTTYQSHEDKWGQIRMVLVPFTDKHGRKYIFGASMNISSVNAILQKSLLRSVIIGGFILLAAIVVNLFVARKISQPIIALTKTAEAIAAGDLQQKLTPKGGLELRSLAKSINLMSAKITEKVTALRAEREHLHITLNSIGDAVIATDTQGDIIQMNPVAQELTGWDFNQAKGMPVLKVFNIVHAQTRERAINPVERVLENGISVSLANHTALLSRDGQEYQIADSAAPILDSDGSIVGVVLVFRDITEEYTMQQALKDSEERFDTALQAVSDALWDWNLTTGEIYFSPRYFEMLEYEPDELPKSLETWKSLLHPEDKERTVATVLNYIEDATAHEAEQPFSAEFRLKMKNGGWKWILGRGRVTAKDENDKPTRIVGTHIDMTERKQTEEFIIQSEKMMSVGGLAAGMAHEINNPLAVISGATQNLQSRLLRDTPKNRNAATEVGVSLDGVHAYVHKREAPRMLKSVSEATMRASTIVNNMLNFSRKSEKQFSTHVLAELLDKTIELASSDYNLKKSYDFRNIEVKRDYEQNSPTVVCDSNQLQQVFLNIIKNGAEAMAEKEYANDKPQFLLTIRAAKDTAIVEIQDNGPGLNSETRKHIFEPFYTTKPVGQGTGLGLSVSYFIITDQHKGKMEVISSPGEWTRFVIHLPTETPA